ncbi:lipopolysaccharide transport periplasmic protein LptA [Paenalcaligenes faecalis]|uniref:lipopolysaccharide transport periplasmic protein LptA n=1 Tax=Paenalcaligenes faecalis TaxID=2980099 RepID=UPI0022B94930|nr:lipopolysaccharide transport periplasmic protein LptA [Paenalcaligenes faecalis]
MKKQLLLPLYLCLSLLSVTAFAQSAEPDTVILSDSLHYDDAKRQSIFSGNVILTRGNLNLHADNVEVNEQADGTQHAIATVKNSARVQARQESPEKYEVIKGEGLRAEYHSGTEQLTLIGQATLTRYICGKPIDTIRGERVVYNKKTDTYQALGGPQSSDSQHRVRSVARPRAQIERAIAECQQKSN